ncbi:Signal transduction histidine kinase [Rubellimicrobium mesophilum DSM 19309]|uniref:histidine kinase n=1 Tax=Rubellimicrobium mesophilum DSM 19309 TaxID=442562 RepID=A0A017HJ86_9RHOB|nr:ATP-binding protein [Rubellimicrobium mesophilum]EYD74218.1 Signal transduction histidine kinase [Rubellimicrobium mesophilum DSM 19309]
MAFRSMRFQTAAIIVVSFLLSHAAGLLFYSLDRQEALAMTEAIDRAERAAGISRLLHDLPDSWRNPLVRSSDSRAFRVWVSQEPAVVVPEPTQAELDVAAYLRTQVPRISESGLRVRFIEETGYRVIPPPFDPASRAGSPPWAVNVPFEAPNVAISIRQGPDEWINFLGLINRSRSLPEGLFYANLISAVIGIALVAFWLVSRVTSPLGRLADAAESLGRNLYAKPLAVTGPKEVAVAAAAFNSMQNRLVKLIQGRTELLAAISHDLRTPLTQIRLRLEMMPASEEREKNLRALDDVDAIIGTFLTFARASHEAEDKSRIDLGALVGSICDDLADSGAAIECDVPSGLVVACKRLAIKRAVTNLVENAIKYGHEARVSVAQAGGRAVISVEDRGPGIPEEKLEAVFAPFYRGDRPAPPTPVARAWASASPRPSPRTTAARSACPTAPEAG